MDRRSIFKVGVAALAVAPLFGRKAAAAVPDPSLKTETAFFEVAHRRCFEFFRREGAHAGVFFRKDLRQHELAEITQQRGDQVIFRHRPALQPRNSRILGALALSASFDAPIPPTKFGLFRM